MSNHRVFDLAHDSGRQFLLHVYAAPIEGSLSRPVIVFSHGAGSSGERYRRLYEHWLSVGAVVVAPDHISQENRQLEWDHRIEDLNRAAEFARSGTCAELAGGNQSSHIWLAGHSYGAVCAAALAGAAMATPFGCRDSEVSFSGLIALSPPGEVPGMVPASHWASSNVPTLLQYGDADVIAGFVDRASARYAGFDAVEGVERWVIASARADHTFGGLICDAEPGALADSQRDSLDALGAATAAFVARISSADLLQWAHCVEDSDGRIVRGGQAHVLSAPSLILEKGDGPGFLRVWRAHMPIAVVGVLPGYMCEARRYDWLGGLSSAGITVVIAELDEVDGLGGFEAFVSRLRTYGVPIFIVGHSAGGALALDALEINAERNVRLVRPEYYEPPSDIVGVIAMSTSLQPQMLSRRLPHRQANTNLTVPESTKVLFVTGSQDALATPDLVRSTLNRYRGGVAEMIVVSNCSHYGFSDGDFANDNKLASIDEVCNGQNVLSEAMCIVQMFIDKRIHNI